jgi:hypothetical protein
VPLVALLLLTLADRLLVGAAERHLSGRLSCLGALTGTRGVHIHGFPFLTQVATGHFPDVTVTADGAGRIARLTDVQVTFQDVRMPPLSGLVGRPSPGSVTVGSIEVTATVPLGAGSLLVQLAGRGTAGGPLAGLSQLAGDLPFPVHLDAVQPVAAGVRVTFSVDGGAAALAAASEQCRT